MTEQKAILFDMDGVLIRSWPAMRQCFLEVLSRRGMHYEMSDLMPYIGMGEGPTLQALTEKAGRTYRTDMRDEAYHLYATTFSEFIQTFEGIAETVSTLKNRGYLLAVASSAHRQKVEINLRRIGLTVADFDAVVSGDQVKEVKPSPEIYLHTAKLLNVVPHNCFVVEDALSGIASGLAAGCQVIGVVSSFPASTLWEAHPHFVVEHTKDIVDILL